MAYQSVLFLASGDDVEDARAFSRLCADLVKPRVEMHIMYVGEHHVTGYGDGTARHHIANDMQIRQQLFPHFKSLCAGHGLTGSHIHIEFGDPLPIISRFIGEHSIELLVMGVNPERKSSALAKLVASLIPECRCDFHVMQ